MQAPRTPLYGGGLQKLQGVDSASQCDQASVGLAGTSLNHGSTVCSEFWECFMSPLEKGIRMTGNPSIGRRNQTTDWVSWSVPQGCSGLNKLATSQKIY